MHSERLVEVVRENEIDQKHVEVQYITEDWGRRKMYTKTFPKNDWEKYKKTGWVE